MIVQTTLKVSLFIQKIVQKTINVYQMIGYIAQTKENVSKSRCKIAQVSMHLYHSLLFYQLYSIKSL